MAAKLMCPGCGAKNDPSSRRCRICTAVINAEAPEGDAAREVAAPAPAVHDHFDADVINRQLKPARSRFAGSGGGLSARIAAANGESSPPSPPMGSVASGGYAGSTDVDDEPFDPDALFRDMD